jgi:hypothetical protein
MLRCYIPGVFGFVVNFVIINALLKSKRSVSAERKISSKEINFAVSLVALNFLFVASIFPYTILAGIQINNVLTNQTTDYASVINTLYSFSIWLNYIYEAAPFFMNLGFNKLFRAEICLIMCSNARIPRETSVSATHTNRVATKAN